MSILLPAWRMLPRVWRLPLAGTLDHARAHVCRLTGIHRSGLKEKLSSPTRATSGQRQLVPSSGVHFKRLPSQQRPSDFSIVVMTNLRRGMYFSARYSGFATLEGTESSRVHTWQQTPVESRNSPSPGQAGEEGPPRHEPRTVNQSRLRQSSSSRR